MNLYLWVSPSAKVDVMYRQLCICVGMHLIVVMLFVVWVDTNPVRVGDSLHLEAVILHVHGMVLNFLDMNKEVAWRRSRKMLQTPTLQQLLVLSVFICLIRRYHGHFQSVTFWTSNTISLALLFTDPYVLLFMDYDNRCYFCINVHTLYLSAFTSMHSSLTCSIAA